MRLRALVLASAMLAVLLVPGTASAGSERDCNTGGGFRTCLALVGADTFLDTARVTVRNDNVVEVCGILYVSKNANIDWQFLPECVGAGTKLTVSWDISRDFDVGTVFCTIFIGNDGTSSGQPCVVMPLPPPPTLTPDNASGCNTANRLKQCISIHGFVLHVDYIIGKEFGIPTGRICGTERLYKEGAEYRKGRLCVPKGSRSSGSVTWTLDVSYPPNTDFCTQFTTDHGTKSGKPCEEVG